jgi:Dynamin family
MSVALARTHARVCVRRYARPGSDSAELEQQADGLFVRRLPAALLREMHIVDTPGTNVILERQQRLTEEYVPRADLVLFVLSADRPLSESELAFLQYIRRWRKKVVFVVNKVRPWWWWWSSVVGVIQRVMQRECWC